MALDKDFDLPADQPFVRAVVDGYVVDRKGVRVVLTGDAGRTSLTAPISDMGVPVGTEVRLLVVSPRRGDEVAR